jgi:hypothetical protein
MLCCVLTSSAGEFSVPRGEVRWAIATLRDLNRTSADRLDPKVSIRVSWTNGAGTFNVASSQSASSVCPRNFPRAQQSQWE